MKPNKKLYDEIPALPKTKNYYLRPGAYCKGCGLTFSLHSCHKPDGTDENGKAYYNDCFACDGSSNAAAQLEDEP